jgi:hypothetical protein
MRYVILTAAFALASGSAMASSILPIHGKHSDDGHSILKASCVHCPPPKPPVFKKAYVVPQLPEGTQTTVVREIDGEQKVVRTEAWMGGSPVVFISKASPEALAAAGVQSDGVDIGSKTAAVPDKPDVKPLNTSDFELRQ